MYRFVPLYPQEPNFLNMRDAPQPLRCYLYSFETDLFFSVPQCPSGSAVVISYITYIFFRAFRVHKIFCRTIQYTQQTYNSPRNVLTRC